MWTRRQFLSRSALGVLGATSTGLAFQGDGGAERQVLPDGSQSRGMVTTECEKAVERGLEFLARSQSGNGAWGSNTYRENVAVTSLAALAMMASGSQPGRGKYGDRIKKALNFVLGTARGGGAFRMLYPEGFLFNTAAPGQQGPMYSHGFGTLFLGEVLGMVPDETTSKIVRSALHAAVNVILASQNGEGGWRYLPSPHDADISVTVCQIMALRSAKNAGVVGDEKDPNRRNRSSARAVRDNCIKYVKECQSEDGSFVYQKAGNARFPFLGNDRGFARTAAGVAALYSAGIYTGPEIDRGLRFLRDNRLINPGGRADMHYFYGHYYAVQCMWTAGGSWWTDWYPSIRDELIHNQLKFGAAEGSWEDQLCTHYGTAMACIILQVPNNYLPILQK